MWAKKQKTLVPAFKVRKHLDNARILPSVAFRREKYPPSAPHPFLNFPHPSSLEHPHE